MLRKSRTSPDIVSLQSLSAIVYSSGIILRLCNAWARGGQRAFNGPSLCSDRLTIATSAGEMTLSRSAGTLTLIATKGMELQQEREHANRRRLQHHALGVDHEMTLLTHDLVACIMAMRVDRRPFLCAIDAVSADDSPRLDWLPRGLLLAAVTQLRCAASQQDLANTRLKALHLTVGGSPLAVQVIERNGSGGRI